MQTSSLLGYLGAQAYVSIIRKGVFTGEHVLFLDYMANLSFLYETGAILGYTYRDRMISFVSLFCQPGRESNVISIMAEGVTDRLAALGHEPKDFMELYFIPEATRSMRLMRDQGLTNYSDWIDFPKLAKHKIKATNKIGEHLSFTVSDGVAFGYSRPELAEKLFKYEHDPQSWQDFRSHGLDIPASPTKAKSIHQRQVEALELIRPYVAKERPDLLNTLGL